MTVVMNTGSVTYQLWDIQKIAQSFYASMFSPVEQGGSNSYTSQDNCEELMNYFHFIM